MGGEGKSEVDDIARKKEDRIGKAKAIKS